MYESIAKLTRADYEPNANRPKAVLFEGPPGTGIKTEELCILTVCYLNIIYVMIIFCEKKYKSIFTYIYIYITYISQMYI